MSDTQTDEEETTEPVLDDVDSATSKSGYSTAVKAGGTTADIIGRLLWVGVLLGAVVGALNYLSARLSAPQISAPQLAALAAESLTMAVLPYVLARAWDELCRPPRWR